MSVASRVPKNLKSVSTDEVQSAVSDLIRFVQRKRWATYSDIADPLGAGLSTVGHYANGRRIPDAVIPSLLVVLAEILNDHQDETPTESPDVETSNATALVEYAFNAIVGGVSPIDMINRWDDERRDWALKAHAYLKNKR